MPVGIYERKTRPPLDRFIEKITLDGDCWLWNGAINPGGYGTFYMPRSPVLAHRFSYEFFKEPVPEGLDLDHLCRRRSCVNPYHLEAVNRKENCRRGLGGQYGRGEFCRKGHAYTPGNTYINPRGARVCRKCKMSWQRRYRFLQDSALMEQYRRAIGMN